LSQKLGIRNAAPTIARRPIMAEVDEIQVLINRLKDREAAKVLELLLERIQFIELERIQFIEEDLQGVSK
jgi:hypothetical protein